MIWRLNYDRSFARPGVWMLNALAGGIRARVGFDSTLVTECVLDLEIRWQMTHGAAPDAVYAHPTLSGSWLTEVFEIGYGMGRGQLELRGPPIVIDAALRRL